MSAILVADQQVTRSGLSFVETIFEVVGPRYKMATLLSGCNQSVALRQLLAAPDRPVPESTAAAPNLVYQGSFVVR